MWVEVEGRKGPYLFGSLSNQPVDSDEPGAPLIHGDHIVFLPEHVINITSKADTEKEEQARERIVAEISEEEALFTSELAEDPEVQRKMALSGFPIHEIREKYSIESKNLGKLTKQKTSLKSKLASLSARFRKL